MPERRSYLGWLALLSAVALCLVVGGVGLVALVAEFQGNWTAYHTMERTMAAAAPVSVVLLAVGVVTWFGTAVRAG